MNFPSNEFISKNLGLLLSKSLLKGMNECYVSEKVQASSGFNPVLSRGLFDK